MKQNDSNSQIGYEQPFVKRTRWHFGFLTKKCSTLMEFTTHKMRESGRQVVSTRMRKVPLSKDRNFLGKCWSGSEYVPKGCPLWSFSTREQLIITGTSSGTQIWKGHVRRQLDLSIRWSNPAYSAKNWRLLSDCLIDKDQRPRNSRDLNPLDDCIWDEFARAINWHLRRLLSMCCEENPSWSSCASSTNRLYRLKQANGNSLTKSIYTVF